MDNKAYNQALEEVTSKYYKAWEATDIKDVELREKLYMAHRLIKQVGLHISIYVSEGKLEQKNIVSDIKRR
jgi:hypothetical protein